MIANRIVLGVLLSLSYLFSTMPSYSHDFLRWRFLTSENGLAESWISSITIAPDNTEVKQDVIKQDQSKMPRFIFQLTNERENNYV